MLDWPEFLDFTTRQICWTIVVGMLCNTSCALLGCFLVLRRMSMLGDALSHAVLPGLAIAFIVTASTSAVPMFIGAAAFAMLTAGLSRLLTSLGHTSEESGLGIIFTAFFALGILLIQLYAENVHLDRDAVLEGAMEWVTLDTMRLGGREWPVSFWVTGGVLGLVLGWLLLFWKEIKAATFDPVYASAIGLYGQTMLGLLIVLVALCVVSAFKVVGSVLVVAMLVVPAAAAQLMSQKLFHMLLYAVLFANLSTISGYLLAREWNTSAAGMMSVMAGMAYLGALLFSPSQGILFIRLQRRSLQGKIFEEDILAVLYRWQEQTGEQERPMALAVLKELAGPAYQDSVLRQLQREGLILRSSQEELHLTDQGRQQGQQIVRGHRLWETFLGAEFELPADHLHQAAHHMEHYLDEETHQQIATQLGSPESDPHGREIPPR